MNRCVFANCSMRLCSDSFVGKFHRFLVLNLLKLCRWKSGVTENVPPDNDLHKDPELSESEAVCCHAKI